MSHKPKFAKPLNYLGSNEDRDSRQTIDELDQRNDAGNFAKCWWSMHGLSERILKTNSLTLELELWSREQGIGDGRVAARCNRNASCPRLDLGSLDALMNHAGEEIAYRSVQLVTAAGTKLVDADNWYFPDRLTSEMRRELETTDIPFGRVIAGLRPRRRAFLVKQCTPTELEAAHENREPHRRGPESTRLDYVFEHRALIRLDDGRPLAVVHERFRAALVCEHLR